MTNNPLTAKVNFYISVFFIASFGLLMVIMVLNIQHLDNPLIDATLSLQDALQNN